MHYLADGRLSPYRVLTSNDNLLKNLLSHNELPNAFDMQDAVITVENSLIE